MSIEFSIDECHPERHAAPIQHMIQELATFERMSEGPKLTADQIATDLREKACFGFIASTVVDNVQEYVGYCLCFYSYSTWEGKFIFLEDLYVKSEYRKKGIGHSMLKRVVKKALDEKLPRVQWNVLDWNVGAIEYYKKLGAVNLHATEGWSTYRLDKAAIGNLCQSDSE